MTYNPELRFSRQVNYPDLAWNIHALVYAYKLNDNYEAIEGLLALDVAYRNESNTYEKFSKRFTDHFTQKLNDRQFGKAVANAKTVVIEGRGE